MGAMPTKATTSAGVKSRARRPSPKSPTRRARGAFSRNGWKARPHQQKAYARFQQGTRRMALIWHRRAGKDSFSLNLASDELEKNVGAYWHMYPLHSQARRAIWWGMSKDGKRFIDQAFPPNKREKVYETDMMIRYENGSTWQLLGSDYYDRLVGANTRGVVFSEWALCDPRAWDYIRPIIRENDGWAIFITTYRGRNHAYQMVQRVKDNPEWYVDISTVEDTTIDGKRRILTDEDIDAERNDGMLESLIQQEYYCNPLASATGAVYASAIEGIETGFSDYPYDPLKPVYVAWSFAYAPANISAVFIQPTREKHRIIGSKSWMFTPFSDCLADIPWRRHKHIIRFEESDWADMFEQYQIDPEVTQPILDGKISAVTHAFLEQTQIDTVPRDLSQRVHNEALIESLNGYKMKEIDFDTWDNKPVMAKEIYLVRAIECFGIWQFQNGADNGTWYKKPDYSIADRLVV